MGEVIERDLMSPEEFEEYLIENRKFRRDIRRGRITADGYLVPKRPFNNRANKSKRKKNHSRGNNELKKQIYEQLKGRI